VESGVNLVVTVKTVLLPRLSAWILPGAALCAVILVPGSGTLTASDRHVQASPPGQTQGQGAAAQSQDKPKDSPQQEIHPPRGGGPGGAPRPDWTWWKDDQVKTEVGLTAWQVRRIDQIFQQRAQELTPLVDEWQKQGQKVDQLIRERTVTAEQLDIELLSQEALRSKLNESRRLMLYRMYLVLNPDQYKKLRAVFDQRARGRRGGGAPR
jgi:hypothetical protein